MKIIYCIFLTLLLSSCQTGTAIFLVRHAEKMDNSRDPELSETGILRAKKLAIILKNENIKEVYTTNYKRTRSTADPLCRQNGLTPILYTADSLNTLAGILLKKNQPTLVVGHSNTTISMLDALGVSHTIQTITDDDYSNLFKVTVSKNGHMKRLEELKF